VTFFEKKKLTTRRKVKILVVIVSLKTAFSYYHPLWPTLSARILTALVIQDTSNNNVLRMLHAVHVAAT